MDLKKGQILEGEITRIVDEAVFVDIGARLDAVIPRKDIDRLDRNQLEDIREGETVKVFVYHVPPQGGNPLVSAARALNLERSSPVQTPDSDPWNTIEAEYQVGDLVEGTIKNIKRYGAFVELPVGVDGLIHVSEMKPGYTSSPWEVVKPGEQVTVRIIRIEPDRKRIGLSLKGVSENNGSLVR
jgi:small subunit ribosomal protein S1